MFPLSSPVSRRTMLAVGVVTVSALSLAACATDEQSGAAVGAASGATSNQHGRLDDALYAKAVAAAKELRGSQTLDKKIEFIGVNGGAEGDVLKGVYQAFTEGTGTTVNYTASQDITSIVQSRVAAGNPPDVVDQAIGVARQYASQGKLVDVGEAVGMDKLKNAFSDALLEDVTDNGKVFGVYQGFSNFMVWYNPKTYTGPTSPKNWGELVTYTKDQAAKGKATWCIAEEAGGSSGFPGAQFVENLFAKKYGPKLLEQWGSGKLSWTSPQVKDAFQMFGGIATDDEAVSGGRAGALAAPIATGYNGLTAQPPTCQLALWGAWVPGLIGATAKPGENIDFFKVPGFDNDYSGTEIFQSTVTTAFKNSPSVDVFLKYIASPEAQALLASANQWPVADKQVSADTYTSPMLKKAATTYFGADDVRLSVGPNVLAGSAVQTAFYKAVVGYLQDPSSLDKQLASVQAAAGPSS